MGAICHANSNPSTTLSQADTVALTGASVTVGANQYESGDHADVAETIRQEAPALTHERDDGAGDRGPDEPCAVDHGRVERDGVRQIAALDELDDERLAGGDVEGVGDAEQRRKREDVPDADDAAKRECGEPERQHHHRALRRDENAAPVQPIGQDTAKRGEQEHRNLAREADEPEQQRRSRQAIDEPGLRDHLHPRADERDELPGDEEPVVAGPQRAGRVGKPHGSQHVAPKRRTQETPMRQRPSGSHVTG